MEISYFENLTNHKAIELIQKALEYLNDEWTQKQIAFAIGYSESSLSKAKSPKHNPNSKYVGSKTRQQVLQEICQEFEISFDRETDSFYYSGTSKDDHVTWYIFYFFSSMSDGINRGSMAFDTKGKAKMKIFHPQNPDIFMEFSGKHTKSDQYLFIELARAGNLSYSKSLHTYYIGNTPLWQSIYLGTYSGIKDNGLPIVGRALITKVKSRSDIPDLLRQPVDDRIYGYLKKSFVSIGSTNVLPKSLDDLISEKEKDLEFFVGNYRFMYMRGEGIIEDGIFSISISGKANADFERGKYTGYVKITESNTMEIKLVQISGKGQFFGAEVNIMAHVLRPLTKPKVISAICLGRDENRNPRAYHALLMMPETFGEDSDDKAFIEAYFNRVKGERMVGMSQGEVKKFYRNVTE